MGILSPELRGAAVLIWGNMWLVRQQEQPSLGHQLGKAGVHSGEAATGLGVLAQPQSSRLTWHREQQQAGPAQWQDVKEAGTGTGPGIAQSWMPSSGILGNSFPRGATECSFGPQQLHQGGE